MRNGNQLVTEALANDKMAVRKNYYYLKKYNISQNRLYNNG